MHKITLNNYYINKYYVLANLNSLDLNNDVVHNNSLTANEIDNYNEKPQDNISQVTDSFIIV